MKYGNGYLPKIAYHMWMGYTDKVMYFVNRQTENSAPNTDFYSCLLLNFFPCEGISIVSSFTAAVGSRGGTFKACC